MFTSIIVYDVDRIEFWIEFSFGEASFHVHVLNSYSFLGIRDRIVNISRKESMSS